MLFFSGVDIINQGENIESTEKAISICNRMIENNLQKMKKVFLDLEGEVDKLTYPDTETILNDLHNMNKAIETLEISKRHLSDQLFGEV
jgi:hypothetical protein